MASEAQGRRRGPLAELVRVLIRGRITHREVGPDELERLAQSRHHEGVVVFARPPPWPAWLDWVAAPGPAQLAVVEPGLNPHNLGAIVRSAAHFGLRGLGAVEGPAHLAGAAARIAEGAAERVPYVSVTDPAEVVGAARDQGYRVAAGASDGEIELFGWRPESGRVLWLLGQEGSGLSPALGGLADCTVRVPGTGEVDSLNVSVAAALMFAEGWRMGGSRPSSEH